MNHITLHQCNLAKPDVAAAHLHKINPQDMLLFYGQSADWLNNAFIEQCQQSAAAVYCINIHQQNTQKLDYAGWVKLACKADKIYTWK
ncbi:hypothetical protein [Marinicella sp. W31]|uniref:hypothetical protein n=1 Tax=Marinicella sp. W31 TaxID=3023713 RepID=UPI0037567756